MWINDNKLFDVVSMRFFPYIILQQKREKKEKEKNKGKKNKSFMSVHFLSLSLFPSIFLCCYSNCIHIHFSLVILSLY